LPIANRLSHLSHQTNNRHRSSLTSSVRVATSRIATQATKAEVTTSLESQATREEAVTSLATRATSQEVDIRSPTTTPSHRASTKIAHPTKTVAMTIEATTRTGPTRRKVTSHTLKEVIRPRTAEATKIKPRIIITATTSRASSRPRCSSLRLSSTRHNRGSPSLSRCRRLTRISTLTQARTPRCRPPSTPTVEHLTPPARHLSSRHQRLLPTNHPRISHSLKNLCQLRQGR